MRAGPVNQAKLAVDCTRAAGASQVDVRAIVAEWRARRPGWQQHRESILYRRLHQFDREQPIADGWPPLDESYLAKIEFDQRRRLDGEALDKQLATRRAIAAERDRNRREWQEQGLSIAAMAREIDADLAEGIATAQKRADVRRRQAEREAARLRDVANRFRVQYPRPP